MLNSLKVFESKQAKGTNYIKQKLLKIYMKREVGILDCLAEIFKHK
jgi:hypothetical protein